MATTTTGKKHKKATKEAGEEEEENALYKLLGVPVNATEKQIKKAYHTKARHVHPDRCGGSVEAKRNFQILQKAYEILYDPEKRKLYDRTGCTDTDNNQFWEAYKHYREAFPEITKDDILAFEKEYRYSTDERDDVLDFYVKHTGNVSNILGFILCSRDEDIPRFVKIIDGAIKSKNVEIFPQYNKSKKNIYTSSELDNMEMENGEDIGGGEEDDDDGVIEEEEEDESDGGSWIVYGEEEDDVDDDDEKAAISMKTSPNGRKENSKNNVNDTNDEIDNDPLAALRAKILGRGKERHTSMVDMLAAKYGGGNGGSSSRSSKKKKRSNATTKRNSKKKKMRK
jgi:curved DNA-binding protein CbpA